MSKISIKPDREYFYEVCAKIDKNRFAVPLFQRDYVWKPKQVKDLFDSINRGFPIGSIVLWKSDRPMKSKQILTDELLDTPMPDFFILDGRQRVTTFYGCISTLANKPQIFCLGYDLEREQFCYASEARNGHPWLQISDIYDTLTLIDKIAGLSREKYGDKASIYQTRAKLLNTTLQTYTVGEFYLSECSLNESTEVFSRINSTGTKINDVDMAQALLYDASSDVVTGAMIDNILSKIKPYGFGQMKQGDILNCFYKFWDLVYFDVKLKDLLSKIKTTSKTVEDKLPDIMDCIIQTARFLHNNCYVMDSCLLPYSRQFVLLSWFFKEHRHPSENQLAELKRWFYYTTASQQFLNGSLTNMRQVHGRFEKFVNNQVETAADYEPIRLVESFDFRFSCRTAMSDFLILSQIRYYIENGEKSVQEVEWKGLASVGKHAVTYFPKLEDEDSEMFSQMKHGEFRLVEESRDKFALTKEMIYALARRDCPSFERLRTTKLRELEQDLLSSIDLPVALSVS